jgi:hypothetical protein
LRDSCVRQHDQQESAKDIGVLRFHWVGIRTQSNEKSSVLQVFSLISAND